MLYHRTQNLTETVPMDVREAAILNVLVHEFRLMVIFFDLRGSESIVRVQIILDIDS